MNAGNDDNENNVILMSHGGGGLRTKELIERIMLRRLGNPILEQMDDGACISMPETDLVFTTDSYVVNPPFFPGGDIGKLAACGTINDLAMQGAEPRYLSCSLIIEEGFSMSSLDRIVESLAESARAAGALIVTGDTKVIERKDRSGNESPGIFINTAGIGARLPGVDVHVSNARPGDAVIVTGEIGNHGAAIMCCRERGLGIQTELVSDVAPLWEMIKLLLSSVSGIRCLRDPTRGGVASALCDIAGRSAVAIRIREAALPARKEVRGICSLLGLDPLATANEGNALVVCPPSEAIRALQALRSCALGEKAALIGSVESSPPGTVILETIAGGERIVEMPNGDDLPRIC